MKVAKHTSVLSELRERGVLRVAASYAVIAWLLLQIASVVFDPLGVPKWAFTALIITAAVGFPLAVALAWFLEIGEHGIERDMAAEGVPRPSARGLRHYADAIVIGVLLVTVVALAVKQSDLGRPKPPENPAIAVLPFENLSGDPNQEYFSDGLAEEMLDRLGRVPGLRVIARSSSFRFKGKDEDIKTIAETLGVTTILEGSVRRDGKHLRLSARLIDGATGQETWSGSFDRQITDVFKVQEELARAVVDAVIPAARGEIERRTPPDEADLSAYETYLLAKTTEWQRTPEAVNRTIELLERSIERDPNYAPSHAQLALSLYTSIFYAGRDPVATRAEMKREAHAAVALDPELPAAQLAQVIAGERDVPIEQTLATVKRIVERYPNYARAMFHYAGYLGQVDRHAESAHWFKQTLLVDPLAITPRLNVIGSLEDSGDVEGAGRELARYEQLHSDDAEGQFMLARGSLRGLGDPVLAVKAVRRFMVLSAPGPAPEGTVILHRALIAAGDHAAADDLVRDTNWSTFEPGRLVYEQALAAGARGDLAALGKALDSLRALPKDPARNSALMLWLAVAGDCRSALQFRWPDDVANGGPLRNYTLTGFESEDAYLADLWCTYGPGIRAPDRTKFDHVLAEEIAHLAGGPQAVDDLFIVAALYSINRQDDQAIDLLRRAVARAPLSVRFIPAYPWFARLAGRPEYDRLVERRTQAQADARRRIAASAAAGASPGPSGERATSR